MIDLKSILLAFHQRPIAYYPIYRHLAGSTTGAVLLSQLMYWWFKMKGKKFYKTDAELIEETLLTQDEFKAAKAKLKLCEFLIITREGLPAVTFYEIDYNSLLLHLNQVCGNPTNCTVEIPPTVQWKSHQHIQETTSIDYTGEVPAVEQNEEIITPVSNQESAAFVPKCLVREKEVAGPVYSYLNSEESVRLRERVGARAAQMIIESEFFDFIGKDKENTALTWLAWCYEKGRPVTTTTELHTLGTLFQNVNPDKLKAMVDYSINGRWTNLYPDFDKPKNGSPQETENLPYYKKL